jgi:hypothetical protein
MKSSDNGQKSMQRTLVKMTVRTVQPTLVTIPRWQQCSLHSRAHQTNNSRHNMSDNARAQGLDNGKQQTDLGKLDAVDGNSVVTPRKQGDTNKP